MRPRPELRSRWVQPLLRAQSEAASISALPTPPPRCAFVTTRSYSFWNRIDNDAAHGAWTHRSSAQRMNRPDFLIQRIDDIEETEYGYIQRRAGFSSGHVFMPNGRLFWIKTRARGYEGRSDL